MRQYIIFLSVLGLAGCAGYSGQVNNAVNRDATAWQEAQRKGDSVCSHFINAEGVIPKNKAIENYQCRSKILKETVLPVAMFPEEVMNLDVQMATISKDYKNGKIDREEANIRSQKANADYMTNVSNKLRSVAQNAAYMDEMQRQRMLAISQSLQQPPSNTTTTNCHFIGNMMQCTEL